MNRSPAALEVPAGVRDLLPDEALYFQKTATLLHDEFASWGYERVMTPAYEYEDVVKKAFNDSGSGLRWVDPASGEILVFRSDFTAQVARLAASQISEKLPLRWCYEGSVVRQDTLGHVQEFFQTGVELIGLPFPFGELEILSLLQTLLARLGLRDVVVDMSHAGLLRGLLAQLSLSGPDEILLRRILSQKNSSQLKKELRRLAKSPELRRFLAALPMLFGQPAILKQALALSQSMPLLHRPLIEIEQILAMLSRAHVSLPLSVDLGEVRGFGYYTGMRFAVYARGSGHALISGGRYDGVMGRFGQPNAAIGFAVHVDRLFELVQTFDRGKPRALNLLVGGPIDEVMGLARQLRQQRFRVTLGCDLATARPKDRLARARGRGASHLVWIENRSIRWQSVNSPARPGRLPKTGFLAMVENPLAVAQWRNGLELAFTGGA